MSASLTDWFRLGREAQAAVGFAVDNGEQVEDPQLRPVAVALAVGLLNNNGWRLLRRPGYLVVLVLAFAAPAVLGLWWWLLADFLLALLCFWLVERQARRLRPQWQRAVQVNSDAPVH